MSAVVLVPLYFDADAMNFADDGNDADVTFAYDAAEGQTAGCVKFTTAAFVATANESATQTASQTWASLGVPAGHKVTSVSCETFYRYTSNNTTGPVGLNPSFEEHLKLSVVNAGGTAILDDDLVDIDPGQTGVAWGSGAHVPVTRYPTSYDASLDTAQARFKLTWTWTCTDFTLIGALGKYVDDIVVAINYEPYEDISGGGNDTGGGGGGTGTLPDEGLGGEETDGDCERQDLAIGAPVQDYQRWATGWFHENRYYLSLGGRTVCFDTVAKGWSDCGYGRVNQAYTVNVPAKPELMLLARARSDVASGTVMPEYGLTVELAHRMLDFEAFNTSAPWVRRVYYGPFDGKGPDRTRRKRAKRLLVFGGLTHKTEGGKLKQLGTLTIYSDTGREEVYPILPVRRSDYGYGNPHVDQPGVLIEQKFTNAMVGRVLWIKMEFDYECVTLSQVMLEYVPIS